MPFIYDKNTVAVEKEEICLEYWNRNSEQYLRAKRMGLICEFWSKLKVLQVDLYRHESKPYGVKRLTRGGNGRRLLINYDTLPAAVQDFLGDPRKCDNPLYR